uniref:Uncharacterized protein n=1 Tax=Rhizophora mucronata TaxID=61149 RepID=A0A2P2IR38_RHIMU
MEPTIAACISSILDSGGCFTAEQISFAFSPRNNQIQRASYAKHTKALSG